MAKKADKFDCKKCSLKNCDVTGEIEGSLGPATYPVWAIDNVGEFNICPLPMITPRSNRLLELHGFYKNNILPLSGGILDQPNLFMEAMRQIDSIVNEK